MARGWESKAVADQMEDADKLARQRPIEEWSPENRARREQLQSVMMSRTRILAQLEKATHAKHREMLQQTLKALEAEIEGLD